MDDRLPLVDNIQPAADQLPPAYYQQPSAPFYNQQPPSPAYNQQLPAPAYNQQPPATAYKQEPPATAYKQQPSSKSDHQQPTAPAYNQQPSAPTEDLKPRADDKKPPISDQPPPPYDQVTKKRKFVSPPLSTSRWPSPYSQQSFTQMEEFPVQSVKPVVNQPTGDGIFSLILAGERVNSDQRYTMPAGAGDRFYPEQRNTRTEMYPEDECFHDCMACCLCFGYCLQCTALFCEILSACK